MTDRADLLSSSRGTRAMPGARRRRALVQRILPLAVLAIAAIGAPLLLLESGGLGRLDRLAEERQAVELEISRITKRIGHLRSEARGLKKDPTQVERVARDQLGLVRKTEVVLQFRSRP
jgi:cell division protein FtsB